jgi:RHS repeat-associated protein
MTARPQHPPQFGLINMNARLYDPALGRFLSPDPYVQAPDFSQSFNRYSYCVNNPLMYVDEDGEIAWFIPVIVGIVAGVANVAANWDNIDGFWQGAAAYGVGAGAGVAACFTGGQSFWVVAGVAAGGGAIAGATNNIIAQTGKNFEGFNQVDWGQVGVSSAIGGIAGFAGGAAGYWAANASFLVNGISSPIARSAFVSTIAAGAGHVAGGTAANLIAGQNLGDAFLNSFKGIGKSMAIGGAIGVGTTAAVSFASGVDPLSGNKLKASRNVSTSTQKADALIKKAEDISVRKNGEIQGFVQGDAQAIFQDLTKGAQHIRGNLYKLPDGTLINYHNSTSTGTPTIDINRGGVIYKIRIK